MLLLGALSGCGLTNDYDIPPMAGGVIRLDATLTDAAGNRVGTRTETYANGVRVWLTEADRPVDSTVTEQGAYAMAMKLHHTYRTEFGIPPTLVDTSNQVTPDREVAFYVDTLELGRRGDLVSHPNPFSLQTSITFQLAADAHVDITIYDLSARRVRTLASRTFVASTYTLPWAGTDDSAHALGNGMYWVLLQTAGETHAELVIKQS
jgi:hypothetical protein